MADAERIGFMHIFAQSFWHDSATICGTKAALEDLRDAIDCALISGQDEATAFVNDGEGYRIEVMQFSEDEMMKMVVPYTSEPAMEDWNNTNNPDAIIAARAK